MPVVSRAIRFILLPVNSIILAICCVCAAPAASAQDSPEAAPEPAAPLVRATQHVTAPTAADSTAAVPESLQPANVQPTGSVTLGQRFSLQVRTTFGPGPIILPAFEAGYDMARPPDRYPHDWRDGGGALGRNYGAIFGVNTTSGFTHFAVAAIDREDPRYYPCMGTNPFGRVVHALAFTLVDRSDSGHRTLAISNLAGASAGGFVGMAIYPDGFNDTAHAYQRSALQMTSFVGHNLVAEFSPEIVRALHKFHFPDRIADSFLPADRRPERQP